MPDWMISVSVISLIKITSTSIKLAAAMND